MNRRLPVTPSKIEWILGLIYLILEQFFLPLVLAAVNLILPKPLSLGQLNCIYFLLNFAILMPVFHRFLGATFRHFPEHWLRILTSAVWGFVLYWIAGIAVSALVLAIDPQFSNVNDSTIATMAQEDFAMIALCTVLLVPVSEELLFRGVLFAGIYNRSRVLAFAVSSLVFCAIHVVPYVGLYPWDTLLLCFIQYLPAGIVLGWTYARSGSILSPILIHTAINAIGIFAMR